MKSPENILPRSICAFLLAGTQSGCGKTTLTLALLRAMKNKGFNVRPFKCGPDYIDPGFHARACGNTSVNLDTFLQGRQGMIQSFHHYIRSMDAAVVEGVMGLFDGTAPDSISHSSAECALILDLPVLLVLNARGISGSIAPLVSGFVHWHKDLKIAGVIANQVGGKRHAELLKQSLESAGLPPLLGALPKDPYFEIPERQLGLAAGEESALPEEWLNRIAETLEEYLDWEKILTCCRFSFKEDDSPAELLNDDAGKIAGEDSCRCGDITLAVAADEAFHFTYRENLDILRQHGVRIRFFSPLRDQHLPADADGIWIGGGFPHLFASQLAENECLKQEIRDFARDGGLVYGEGSGLVYLLESVCCGEGAAVPQTYAMCGLLPCKAVKQEKRCALGYRRLQGTAENIFFGRDVCCCGHEYHYMTLQKTAENALPSLWHGLNSAGKEAASADGIILHRVGGSLAQIHLASSPDGVRCFVDQLKSCRKRKG